MKLAVFFPASLFSAWACSYGLVDCLRRMGHEVTSVPIDPSKAHAPQIPADGEFEAVIISGPEHLQRLQSIHWKVPSVAWLHETVEREDYGKLDVEAIKRSADVIFCPAKQDEQYGFRYLPFGVDTHIFQPLNAVEGMERHTGTAQTKSVDAAFIGLLYPKRQAFLAELKKHGVNLVTGNVQVLELGGVNPRKTAELYAENIRKVKVFVNLPTLSQLAVTKIYEVLACGTPILTPEVSDMRNLEGLQVAVYKNAKECADLIAHARTLGPRPGFQEAPVNCAVPGNHASEAFVPDFIADITAHKHRLELRCERLVSAIKELGVKEKEAVTA